MRKKPLTEEETRIALQYLLGEGILEPDFSELRKHYQIVHNKKSGEE